MAELGSPEMVELEWLCPECGGRLLMTDDGEVICRTWDCAFVEPIEDESMPMEFTPDGFRRFYWRPPGTPVAPHSYGPAIGVRPAQLGPTGKELLG